MAVSAEALASAVKGRVVEAGAPDYDEARALYNGMIDRRPAVIAYCTEEADVAAALGYGVEHGLRIAIRGGGHNGAGLGSVDDGLVIDLSQMNDITVDAAASMARVGGGALLKDLLDATHQHGLTVPVGIIGTTGVGGLTLGGGMGHLTRGLGLTIDNLVAATVVLADGSIVQTDASGSRSSSGRSVAAAATSECDVLLLPVSSPHDGPGRAGALRHRRCRGAALLVSRRSARAAGRRERLLRLPLDSARPAVPRGAAFAQGLRHRVDAGRRGRVRGASRGALLRNATARRDRAGAAAGVEHGLRPRLPGRRPVVLAR